MKKIRLFIIAFLLIFASKTLYSFHQNSFSQDVARDLVLIENKIDQRDFLIAYGPKASVGNFYLLPAYYQLHFLLSLLTANHPFTMRFWVILLESITVLIVYLILRQLNFNKKIALGVSFLYFIAPMVMIFSSKAWNPNTIPFFTSLSFYLILSYFKNRRAKNLTWIIFLATLAFHFHLQAMVFLPFIALIVVYAFIKEKNDRKYIYWGLFLAFLTIVPYLLGEIGNHWQNSRQIINYFLNEHSQYYARVSKFDYLFTFLPAFFERLLTHWELPIHLLGRSIFFLGFAYLFYLAIKEKKLSLITFLYFSSIILMLRVYKGDKVDYYMSSLFVLPFILLAYISRLNQQLFIALALLISFFSGKYYAQLKADTAYDELRLMANYVNNLPQKELRLLIHDYNQINTYLYFFDKYTDLKIDEGADFFLEICPQNYTCIDQSLMCLESRSVTYTNLYKELNNFQETSVFKTKSNFNLQLGKIDQHTTRIGYELYDYNFAYGSDLLFDLSYH